MVLVITIILGVIAFLSLLSWLLILFVKKALRNDYQLLAKWLLGLLVLQFVLGMLVNLFQEIPQTKPWEVFHDFGPIIIHTLNATILLILGIIFLVNAIKSNRHAGMARLGLAGIVIAYASGVIFVNAGQNDLYSFTMALGFITAFTVYAYLAFARQK